MDFFEGKFLKHSATSDSSELFPLSSFISDELSIWHQRCQFSLQFSKNTKNFYPNLHNTQCLVSWFSWQENFRIFWISCQDLGNDFWQGSQDFARFFKIVEKIQEKFWSSWQPNQECPISWLEKQKNRASK